MFFFVVFSHSEWFKKELALISDQTADDQKEVLSYVVFFFKHLSAIGEPMLFFFSIKILFPALHSIRIKYCERTEKNDGIFKKKTGDGHVLLALPF